MNLARSWEEKRKGKLYSGYIIEKKKSTFRSLGVGEMHSVTEICTQPDYFLWNDYSTQVLLKQSLVYYFQ